MTVDRIDPETPRPFDGYEYRVSTSDGNVLEPCHAMSSFSGHSVVMVVPSVDGNGGAIAGDLRDHRITSVERIGVHNQAWVDALLGERVVVSEQRIDPVLVEKVRNAVREVLRNEEALVDYSERGAIETCEDVAQAAIKVVVDELPPLDRISFLSGYIVACSDRASGVFPGNDAAVKTFAERAWKQTGVSDWRPVEQGDER